jgi:hypothetical protein
MTKLVQLEREGKTVQVVTSDGTTDRPVEPELGKVQPAEARQDNAPESKVFISYAHKNYKHWERLKVRLDILTNERLVKWWFDGKIRPGVDWDNTIRQQLKKADIVVLMLSNDFFASDYINSVELKEAMQRQQAEEIRIVPVLLEDIPALKKHEWLKKFQTVPRSKGRPKPLDSFNPHANGWSQVEEALRSTIAEIAKQPGRLERNK